VEKRESGGRGRQNGADDVKMEAITAKIGSIRGHPASHDFWE